MRITPPSAYDLARSIIMERHARVRIYPQDVTSVLQLTSGAAGAFGAWTPMIPINTVLIGYHPCGFHVESIDADTYWVQFAKAAAPSGSQVLGEARFKIGVSAVQKVSPFISVQSRPCLANEGIWGRLACVGINTVADFAICLSRHFEYEKIPEDVWPTWPW